MRLTMRTALVCLAVSCFVAVARAQSTDAMTRAEILSQTAELQKSVAVLRQSSAEPHRLADVEVYAKAADWIVRHEEFFKPEFGKYAQQALETGRRRAAELAAGKPSWVNKPGTQIHGYVSRVDGSVQPYAL